MRQGTGRGSDGADSKSYIMLRDYGARKPMAGSGQCEKQPAPPSARELKQLMKLYPGTQLATLVDDPPAGEQ